MQCVQPIPLLAARVANSSYDHASVDHIEWPPAPAVPAGLPPLPQHLPATWTAVKRMHNPALDDILRAYNVVPRASKPEKLKQIQHYIGLRLAAKRLND